MLLGGVIGQLWTVASATYGVGVGAVVCVFVACWTLLRWKSVKAWIVERLRGRSDFTLKSIFNDYIASVASIKDRGELYAEILKIVARLAEAENISLLLRSTATQRYIVRESVGSKPMSFQIGTFDDFINWLCEHKHSVTRAELVEAPEFAEVKTSGLQYCVQFHAEAVVPLVLGDEVIGIINMGCRSDGRDFDNRLLEVFDMISSQFAIAIHNANLYEGLMRQNVKLKQLDELKTQLLANVSHELRTPLNSIIGLSELMSEGGDGPLNKEQFTHLEMIKSSGKRLMDTVSAMLDLSKLEANKLSLDVRRISLSKMLENVTKDLTPKGGVKMDLKIDSAIPTVYGDAVWVEKIFTNLISNAVKYTSQGTISIDCGRAGDMIRVGIHDTGVGISKEDQEKIFMGFAQANGSINREHEGTGLGLAISKKIVEMHGGRIWLDSKPGKGSNFFFTLPLKPNTIPSVEISSRMVQRKAS